MNQLNEFNSSSKFFHTRSAGLATSLLVSGFKMIRYEKVENGFVHRGGTPGARKDLFVFYFDATVALLSHARQFFEANRKIQCIIRGEQATDYDHISLEEFFERDKDDQKYSLRRRQMAINQLAKNNIHSVGDLLRTRKSSIVLFERIGESCVKYIVQKLAEKGLSLKD